MGFQAGKARHGGAGNLRCGAAKAVAARCQAAKRRPYTQREFLGGKDVLDSVFHGGKELAQALSRWKPAGWNSSRPMAKSRWRRQSSPGRDARFHIHDWDVLRRIMARGDIGLGEEYIAGSWDTDNVEKLVSLFLLNLDHLENFSDGSFLNRLGFVIHNALVRRNSIAGSARNIKDHYDVGNDFYSLWLDKSMTYSSALYQGRQCALSTRSRTNMTASCPNSTSRAPMCWRSAAAGADLPSARRTPSITSPA